MELGLDERQMHGAPSTAAANRIADLGWARRSPLRRSLEVCSECSAAAKEVGSPAPDKVPGACFEACPKNLAASKAAATRDESSSRGDLRHSFLLPFLVTHVCAT